MIRVAIFCGSPKKTSVSNTYYLVKKAVKRIKPKHAMIETISLADYNFSFCRACDACHQKITRGVCALKDDFSGSLVGKAREANAVIIATPVYYGGPTALTKMFIDRLECLRPKWELKDRVFAAIAVGGARNGGQEMTMISMINFALIQGMVIVGSSLKRASSNIGGAAVANTFEEVDIDEVGLNTVADVISRAVEIADKIRGNRS